MEGAALFTASVLVAVCAWSDISKRLIYNIATYPAAVSGIVLNVLSGSYGNIKGSLIIFLIYLYFFISGKMGGGDLKLAVALSLLLGIEPVLVGSLVAGLTLLTWGFASTWHRTGQLQTAVMVAAGRIPGGEVPYGAIMGPATLGIAMIKLFI